MQMERFLLHTATFFLQTHFVKALSWAEYEKLKTDLEAEIKAEANFDKSIRDLEFSVIDICAKPEDTQEAYNFCSSVLKMDKPDDSITVIECRKNFGDEIDLIDTMEDIKQSLRDYVCKCSTQFENDEHQITIHTVKNKNLHNVNWVKDNVSNADEIYRIIEEECKKFRVDRKNVLNDCLKQYVSHKIITYMIEKSLNTTDAGSLQNNEQNLYNKAGKEAPMGVDGSNLGETFSDQPSGSNTTQKDTFKMSENEFEIMLDSIISDLHSKEFKIILDTCVSMFLIKLKNTPNMIAFAEGIEKKLKTYRDQNRVVCMNIDDLKSRIADMVVEQLIPLMLINMKVDSIAIIYRLRELTLEDFVEIYGDYVKTAMELFKSDGFDIFETKYSSSGRQGVFTQQINEYWTDLVATTSQLQNEQNQETSKDREDLIYESVFGRTSRDCKAKSLNIVLNTKVTAENFRFLNLVLSNIEEQKCEGSNRIIFINLGEYFGKQTITERIKDFQTKLESKTLPLVLRGELGQQNYGSLIGKVKNTDKKIIRDLTKKANEVNSRTPFVAESGTTAALEDCFEFFQPIVEPIGKHMKLTIDKIFENAKNVTGNDPSIIESSISKTLSIRIIRKKYKTVEQIGSDDGVKTYRSEGETFDIYDDTDDALNAEGQDDFWDDQEIEIELNGDSEFISGVDITFSYESIEIFIKEKSGWKPHLSNKAHLYRGAELPKLFQYLMDFQLKCRTEAISFSTFSVRQGIHFIQISNLVEQQTSNPKSDENLTNMRDTISKIDRFCEESGLTVEKFDTNFLEVLTRQDKSEDWRKKIHNFISNTNRVEKPQYLMDALRFYFLWFEQIRSSSDYDISRIDLSSLPIRMYGIFKDGIRSQLIFVRRELEYDLRLSSLQFALNAYVEIINSLDHSEEANEDTKSQTDIRCTVADVTTIFTIMIDLRFNMLNDVKEQYNLKKADCAAKILNDYLKNRISIRPTEDIIAFVLDKYEKLRLSRVSKSRIKISIGTTLVNDEQSFKVIDELEKFLQTSEPKKSAKEEPMETEEVNEELILEDDFNFENYEYYSDVSLNDDDGLDS